MYQHFFLGANFGDTGGKKKRKSNMNPTKDFLWRKKKAKSCHISRGKN
jgi:hypothetical protein